jgi:predicted RNA binding protein YcfA (HicA-like mRNA interferase family)/predicted RNase H-like HicB family nuclease
MKVREVLRVLAEDGCYQVSQRGSHRQYRHPTKPGKVTVAGKPSEEMAAGTLGSIFRQAGVQRTGGQSMTRWSVVYERTSTGWSAYVPALPGLGVAGATRAEVEQLIREGIPFHLAGLAEDGLPMPDPDSVEVESIAV